MSFLWLNRHRALAEIALDTGKYCFGIDDTLKALELGAVETLIVWEDLPMTRYVMRSASGGK
jgi:peptide chain release factor subunit 1